MNRGEMMGRTNRLLIPFILLVVLTTITPPATAAGFALPPSPPTTPEQEKRHALEREAESALAAGDLDTALSGFQALMAHAPEMSIWPMKAASIATMVGKSDTALALYRQAATLAARSGDKSLAGRANARIVHLLEKDPAWVAQRRAAMQRVTEEMVPTLEAWQSRVENALAMAETGGTGGMTSAISALEAELVLLRNSPAAGHEAALETVDLLLQLDETTGR
ncbi:MAG: hypothetical protein HQL50_05400, partial [Magnetococcales bacterium]|nr:hypothetical protein [Magnetococcales bacterium]